MGWPFLTLLTKISPVRFFLILGFAAGARRRKGWALIVVAGLIVPMMAPGPAKGADGTDAPPSTGWVARSWQSEDGLPQDTVNAIVQTHDGFLWVGTNAGLGRFDGMRFRKFGLLDGLRSVRIAALIEDRQNTLGVGTSGGGVSRWEGGRFTSFGPEEGLANGAEVISLAANREGSVWIGTVKGLVQWNGGTFKSIEEAQGLPRGQVRALLQDSQGTLWVSVITIGLFRGAHGQFTRVEDIGPEGKNVYVLMEDREGSIWAGTDALLKGSGGVWKRFDSASGLPKGIIQALAQSSDGTVWVGTRNGGLYRSMGERFLPAASEGALATQNTTAVIVDREGSVWAGAVSGGLHRLSSRVLDYWGANAGLPRTAVTSAVEEASGTLLVGTADRGIQRFENGRFSALPDPAVSADHSIVYCTAATSDGATWAAGEQFLYRFQPGQATRAYLDPPVRGEAIRALCADGETLWIGTYYSTLMKCDAGGVRVVAPPGSFPGSIACLVREGTDTLWIGTSAGLHRWENGKVRTWTTRDGLFTDNIRSLYRDPDGTLWIGMLGGGLARMKDGRFVQYSTRQGLIDDVISQIVPDDYGNLWLGCNRGIMRIARRELDALAAGKISELHPLALGRNEGMLKETCFGGTSPTVLKTRDGRLFFPTASGLAEIDPRRVQKLTPSSPQTSIDEILLDQQPRTPGTPLVIPPGNHRLDVAYTAPVLRGGEWLHFHHRLKGFDRDWVVAGGKRLVSYDGLPPGDYVFQVAADDGQGNRGESGASLAFSVLPFFWETLWFRAGGVILLISATGSAAWWQLRRKHLHQIADFEGERKQQAELAHASRVALLGELSASLAHELKQPLTAILSNAQAALRFLDDTPADIGEVRDILKDIAAEDRRASEIIGRMRDMMKKGNAQMDTRDLNADVQQALLLIHSDLVTRNASVETQLAPGLPPVRGDHIQLQQVLLNLVVNGCDAMHANPPEERRLAVETALDGSGFVRVSVTDRGAGIAPGMMERIFEPFYSTKETGLGMGLAISQAIIKAHGGRLWAANNPDRGATFHFTLRLGEQPQT